ncbi:MAG: hypothetical protein JJU03_09245 [Idiomarina sp.]|nr:hypothetical protein [Idiomarina sp.]
MTTLSLKKGAVLVTLGFLLSACGHPLDTGPQAEDIAIEFFDRLYNQRDLEGALDLTAVEYRPVLERYGSITAIGRYLYSMNYEQVTIEADSQGVQLYRDQSDTARLQLSFSGIQDKRRVETLRNVVMVREDGEWRLARVLDGRW